MKLLAALGAISLFALGVGFYVAWEIDQAFKR